MGRKKVPRIAFDCEVCGAHCEVWRAPTAKTAPRFCSQKCNGASKLGTGLGVKPNHVCVCEQCGKRVAVYRAPTANPPRFCSLKCLGDSQRGDGNPAWTGGRHVLNAGYFVVLLPDDPEADSRGYVLEHRFIARSIVGRQLLSSEVVHHIDGNKLNNDIENLRIFQSQSEHVKHHAELRRANGRS